MVSLKPDHRPTAGYVKAIRTALARKFPGTMFYFLPADMITQILNFGLPAPIDVQIDGNDMNGNREVADRILNQVRGVPGVVDARIQQEFDYPNFVVHVDRTKAQQDGLTEQDVSNSLLDTLSSSFQTAPMFFLNWKNGVNYDLVAQTPQYDVQSLQELQNIPINGPTAVHPAILADVATITRSQEMAAVDHYNIRRVVDVYASVQGRDLGSAGADIQRIVDANRHLLPRGSFVTLKGQLETMYSAYGDLIAGLAGSILLVYLLIVVNFQSWLDPFIIICALPAALAGIVLFLFFTGTTLSVPALMGAIMCMGVATANSILMVSFARERLAEHGDAVRAATEAGFTRLRPVLMTALAMIIGMVPMALGLGEGGEENAPLGRAVIGGLLLATVATLIFVPTVFALLHGRRGAAGLPGSAAGPDAPMHAE
jgi:multidrug efflux pump subunit AcrB